MLTFSKIISRLKKRYGQVKPPPAQGPFALVMWENACYLLPDARRLEFFEALQEQVRLNAAAIERAPDAVLLALAARSVIFQSVLSKESGGQDTGTRPAAGPGERLKTRLAAAFMLPCGDPDLPVGELLTPGTPYLRCPAPLVQWICSQIWRQFWKSLPLSALTHFAATGPIMCKCQSPFGRFWLVISGVPVIRPELLILASIRNWVRSLSWMR